MEAKVQIALFKPFGHKRAMSALPCHARYSFELWLEGIFFYYNFIQDRILL